MRDLQHKTAFITGGAGGLGLAFARAFLRHDMKVVLADRDQGALARAVASLSVDAARVAGVPCDVADRASMHAAAAGAYKAFGRVHLVCANAGVGGRCAGVEDYSAREWDCIVGVNLMGVANAVAIFLPHLRGHGEGGHFLNVASMAGMLGQPHLSPYSASKAAVVSLSESLAYELKGEPIGVSVLCPGFARTGFADALRDAPGDGAQAVSAAAAARAAQVAQAVASGIEPEEVALRALDGVLRDELYIFTHPDMRPPLSRRLARIEAAYERAGRNRD